MKTNSWAPILLVTMVLVVCAVGCGGSKSSSTHPADDDVSPNADDDSDQSVWTDPTSGLMWQNGPTVGTGKQDQADAETYCATLTWAGCTGWRLPDIDALRSLIRGCSATETGGACGVTDACLSDVKCDEPSCAGCTSGGPGSGGAHWPPEIAGVVGWYWSSSMDAAYATFAWVVEFNYGGIDALADYYDYGSGAYSLFSARCVRGSSSDDDDDDNDDNDDNDDDTADESVWTDTTTGLMWQNGATVGSDQYDWTQAQSYCAGLNWAGYAAGWRLPDIDELRGLLRGCSATDTGGSCGVTDACANYSSCWGQTCMGCTASAGPGPGGAYWPPDVAGDVTWYWSSSTVADESGSAWYAGFDVADVDRATAPSSGRARCVRD